MTPEPLWIFGYGSLIFRPDFLFAERRPAFIRDYQRRFWQGSIDHRGTPEAPGRVVTLLEAPGAVCWGVVYRVEAAESERVLSRLDHREQGGYERQYVTATFSGGASVEALFYRAPPGNRNYLGPATLFEIRAQVERASGPSGANRDYVTELASALRALGVSEDPELELDGLLQPSD